MPTKYDVIVIGAGNAGQVVAGRTRAAGKTVLVIEARDVGGTCPLRGCVPKKVLVAAAEVMHAIDTADKHQISTGPAVLNWSKLIARKQTFVDGVPEQFESSLRKRGIDIVHGHAEFVGPREVEVNGVVYQGKKILISTGSTPRQLPIPGFQNTITSDDLLELEDRPDSLVFIGGGVIALEFSHVMARAGIKVTIIELASRLLPMLDADLVEALTEETTNLGVDIFTEAQTSSIVETDGGFTVTFEHDGEVRTLTTDLVANGAGRVANLDALNLEAAGIELDGSGVHVDAFLGSVSNPDVFVAGDSLVHSLQLSPVASYEGKVVAHNLLNAEMKEPDYHSVPRVVFTVPALASVGLTEQQASDLGLAFTVKLHDMTDWRSSSTHAETKSMAKILVEDDTGRIVGAHLLGHGAQEIIHTFAFAIRYGVDAAELKDFVYVYPTFTSDIRFMV